MRRSLFMFIVVVVVAAQASTATAATTITIDGHFKETQPKGAPPPLCFNGALGIDTACHPGNTQAPGRLVSYGNPGVDSGTWSFLPGTGAGIFTNVCAGSGDLSLHFGGAAGVPVYSGELTLR